MTAAPPPPERSAARPLLIGCGVVLLLLLLCAGGATLLGVRGWNFLQVQMQNAAKDEDFAEKWQAPAADASAETFAPPSVAGYELAGSDEKADFPALGIEREGSHAVYEKGNDQIDVAVYRADEAETKTVFDEVERRIDDEDRFKSHTFTRLPRTVRFGVTDPTTLHGILWHANGWLVFVRSETVSDLDPFLRAYLEAVGETSVPSAPESHKAGAGEDSTESPESTLRTRSDDQRTSGT